MKILLVDQFSPTPTPYELSLRPMRFDEFVALELRRPPGAFGSTPTQLLDVDEGWRQPFATTAFREGADGMVEIHATRWDTSG